MKQRIQTTYIIIFAIIICLPNILGYIFRGSLDNGNYENRELSKMPHVAESGITAYPKDFENFYNDHLPFRNELIELNNRINYYLFDSTMSDSVLIGKDKWLFIKDKMQGNAIDNYTGADILSDDELREIADNIQYNNKLLGENGIELVIMISPNKSRVYSEYMPDYLGEPSDEYAVRQVVDYLLTNTDVKIVYDYQDMITAKSELANKDENPKDILLYHKADTHWNNAGAYVGAAALAKCLGVEMPALSSKQVHINAIRNESADLAAMLHMSSDFIDNESDYEITGYGDNNVRNVQNVFNEVIEYRSDAKDDRCIYICRDSYATAMGPYIGSQFARVYMRHHDTYSVQDLADVSPDVFVYEVVERSAVYKLRNFDAGR